MVPDSPTPATIYKIVERCQWESAVAAGQFTGSEIDHRDGYIHFSTAQQVHETARRHFAGVDDLMIVGVAVERLGDALVWEPSRGGQPFPHLYAPLPLAAVVSVDPLPWDQAGQHRFPNSLSTPEQVAAKAKKDKT